MAAKKGEARSRNRILERIPARDYERIQPALKRIKLVPGKTLHAPNERVELVYFVEQGVVSVCSTIDRGSKIEVATIGREGIVGLQAFFGGDSSPLRSFTQVEGSALVL